MNSPSGNKSVGEKGFADFVAGLFSLMALPSTEELLRYATVARTLNPELSELITKLAHFKESYLSEGADVNEQPLGQGRNGASSPTTTQFDSEIEAMFRDRQVFRSNGDLIRFLTDTFHLQFGSPPYSRTSIIRSFLRFARNLGAIEKSELINNLRSVRNIQAHNPRDRSFFKAWSEVIKQS